MGGTPGTIVCNRIHSLASLQGDYGASQARVLSEENQDNIHRVLNTVGNYWHGEIVAGAQVDQPQQQPHEPFVDHPRYTLVRVRKPECRVDKDHDIVLASVATDPGLALRTRRATGFDKVPSLRGVWHRGMFPHDGSCVTLEDWFDPRRLRDDYVPTGFRGYGLTTRAVKGHAFGLNLSREDKKALMAFLKTL